MSSESAAALVVRDLRPVPDGTRPALRLERPEAGLARSAAAEIADAFMLPSARWTAPGPYPRLHRFSAENRGEPDDCASIPARSSAPKGPNK